MFFTSWALWEQMTFALGLAILVVFAIGYCKLLYTNRIVHKQETVDEEKRMRIKELRRSGQIVDSRRSHDVPFGVRAIQSGIKIDGIWISHPSPSELKLGNLHGSSADMVDSNDSSTEFRRSSTENSQRRPVSKQGRTPTKSTDFTSVMLDKVYESPDSERPTTSGTRASYRPRRSAHSRHGSHSQYDEETLGQLEGTSIASTRRSQAQKSRTSRKMESEGESSVADNEKSSSGTSSDSGSSLSHNAKRPISPPADLLTKSEIVQESTPLTLSNILNGKGIRGSLPLQGSALGYASLPQATPGSSTSDPFTTPLMSPTFATPSSGYENIPLDTTSYFLEDHHLDGAQAIRSPSPFVPGELHVNKTIRKINSGFEVLPAGTFGAPPEFASRGMNTSSEEEVADRRYSMLSRARRPSSTTERS